jgi:hypothetical protein
LLIAALNAQAFEFELPSRVGCFFCPVEHSGQFRRRPSSFFLPVALTFPFALAGTLVRRSILQRIEAFSFLALLLQSAGTLLSNSLNAACHQFLTGSRSARSRPAP